MTQKQNNKTSFGSDHFIHLSILEKIKSNGFKYGVKKISGYNEENSTYPILFHYILACFFYKTAIFNNQLHSFCTPTNPDTLHAY